MSDITHSPVTSEVTPNLTNASTSAATSMPTSPISNDNRDKADVGVVGEQSDDVGGVKETKEVDPALDARASRLSFLLDKSTIYAKIIGDRMARQQIEKQKAEQRAETRKANKEKRSAVATTRGGLRGKEVAPEQEEPETVGAGKRKRKGEAETVEKKAKVEEDGSKVEPETNGQAEAEAIKEAGEAVAEAEAAEETRKQYSFAQPELITGAKLRDYQLAGVQWMISLYENGLNGILADEMGLGKTLQTISFLAHLRSKGTWGPFLIVCPLSVLNIWVMEFEKFAPTIPVLMYHGSPDERSNMRATRLQPPSSNDIGSTKKKGGRKSAPSSSGNTTSSFPVVVTTYEICMKDQKYLSNFMWKFIVVDEGHRLKNFDCKLIRELKTYTSANRMILTGTPLHNNLGELWSLLNFILPDIFDDLDSFQQWFNFDEMPNDESPSADVINRSSVVTSLHAILKPFLLRRLKVDVEKGLPPKKEYLLYAPLTQQQKDIYQAILSGQIRKFLVDKKTGNGQDEEEEKPAKLEVDAHGRSKRKRAKVNYTIEDNDNRYIDNLENGVDMDEPSGIVEKSAAEVGQEWRLKQATKNVNNMHLQNVVMQLRKISSHPFLFDWPIDDDTGSLVVNHDLVEASGKMLLLNRLLDALLARGHKVLIFSQFTKMLDVIEDWLTEFKGLSICRIDGSTSQPSRREQMDLFNHGGTSPDATKLFLLSTRAGGLGINLVEADTVIFFDQDWNPQMDLQAQDRAHRIGQTKPVLIFRLVSERTIETKIMDKAGKKRMLESLVISQGGFGKVVDEDGNVLMGRSSVKARSDAEIANAAREFEIDEVDVVTKDDKIISDQDLDILLDRSAEAMSRKAGWKAGAAAGTEQRKKGEKTAFEVFVPAKDDAADELAAR